MTYAQNPLVHAQQTSKTVLNPEVRRLLRQGGVARLAVMASGIGILVGTLVVLLIDNVTSGGIADESTAGVTVPIEATSSLTALVFAIVVTMHFGRGMNSGLTDASLVNVPRRSRLWVAQYASVALLAACVTALSSIVVGVLAFAKSGSPSAVGIAALGVVAATLAAALLSSLAQSIAYLAGSSSSALLITVVWWVVAPIALGLSGSFLGPTLERVSSGLSNWTPIVMYARAATVSTVPSQGAANLVWGVIFLTALALGMAALTIAVLRRRDF